MNEDITVLEEFTLWFLDQKEVPENMKRKLVGHIRENGIDHWVEDFLQKSMHYLIHVNQEQVDMLKQRLAVLQADVEAENNPETSYRAKVIKERGEKMLALAETFVANVVAQNKALEQYQVSAEQAEAEKLKATI